jgi:uncharacterized protein YndB with AHSA1/START domain
MKPLKILGAVVGVAVALYVVIGLFMPRIVTVERSREIAAPVDIVFAEVADLRRLTEWLPWRTIDSSYEYSYGEASTGVGAWYAWQSRDSGAGKYTLREIVPSQKIVYELEFDGLDDRAATVGTWTFAAPASDRTAVTWQLVHEAAGLGERWANAFLPSALGSVFDEGLQALAERSEALAAAVTEPVAGDAAAAATAAAGAVSGQ